jgi:predicted kinase
MTGPIFLVVGPPAVGKSTTSRALAARFSRGIHIEVDRLREQVVAGYALPGEDRMDDLILQVALARRSASRTAIDYAEAGFAVAIDDFTDPHGMADYTDLLERPGTYAVLLVPSQDEAQRRVIARSGEGEGSAFIRGAIPLVYGDLPPYRERFAREGWLVLDSTDLTVDGTVDAILAHAGIAT